MRNYSEKTIKSLEKTAARLRKDVVISVGVGIAGHIGGSCSAADLVTALYFYKMHHDPKNPDMPDRDRFLLSKGHAAILQYAALAESGYFPTEALRHTKELGFYLQGHPDVRKTPGIEAGTGSLGQGLSVALGMALGQKMNHINRNTYVIVGDGEAEEGQIWEAAMAAKVFHTDNLITIVDRNRLQATGMVKDRFDSGDIVEKFKGFGWHVMEIDGHNMREILTALDDADEINDDPTVIIANTIKGKGISFAENVPGFHNGILTQELYDQALAELSIQEGV